MHQTILRYHSSQEFFGWKEPPVPVLFRESEKRSLTSSLARAGRNDDAVGRFSRSHCSPPSPPPFV